MAADREWIGNVAAAAVWAGLAAWNASLFVRQPSAVQAGLVLFNAVLVALTLARRPARRAGPWYGSLLALEATALPLVALQPAPGGWDALGAIVQGVGLAVMLVSLAALGRSFSVAPVARGLVTRGPYRLVRHPLYASELIALAGFVIGMPSAWNGLVWLTAAAGQVARAVIEERLLAEDAPYQDYRRAVPWRLVPLVW